MTPPLLAAVNHTLLLPSLAARLAGAWCMHCIGLRLREANFGAAWKLTAAGGGCLPICNVSSRPTGASGGNCIMAEVSIVSQN